MQATAPDDAQHVTQVVDERLSALKENVGLGETVTIEWRGQLRPVSVIAMPIDLLSYNPHTHRVRAQRTLDAVRNKALDQNPFGPEGQAYLHQLLMGDPSDPSRIDPTFTALKDDLREHGQKEPGIITRAGVLINGNTRRAAMRVNGQEHIRVGVLPPDAALDDLQSIELSLQLRKEHKREYSFMNFLLAIDERVGAGRPATEIQRDFRIRATTFERSRWILQFVREAIERSSSRGVGDQSVALRLVEFELHQGKLEELYGAYIALRRKAPEQAELLREQRLLAIALNKSKTDVRLIDADFIARYMHQLLPARPETPAPAMKIPGTSISAAAPGSAVQAVRYLTDEVLRARAVEVTPQSVTPEVAADAGERLLQVRSALDLGLKRAGKTDRVVKKRLAAADRISDANDDLELSLSAVADARATSNFDADDLNEVLISLRLNLGKLAQLVCRGSDTTSDGVAWLRTMGTDPSSTPA